MFIMHLWRFSLACLMVLHGQFNSSLLKIILVIVILYHKYKQEETSHSRSPGWIETLHRIKSFLSCSVCYKLTLLSAGTDIFFRVFFVKDTFYEFYFSNWNIIYPFFFSSNYSQCCFTLLSFKSLACVSLIIITTYIHVDTNITNTHTHVHT